MRAIACIARLLFCLFKLFPQRDRAVFMSRQASRPLDFRLLEPELQACLSGWEIAWACVTKGGKTTPALMLRQLYLAATSRLVVVDGYVPAVCLCAGLHRAKCVQLWHATGAMKKFGLQALDTPAGRSSSMAKAFRMHQGYDIVVSGLEGAVGAFSQAFGYPVRQVEVLGLPRMDRIAQRRGRGDEALPKAIRSRFAAAHASGRKIVLYAPTFRKNAQAGDAWLEDSVRALANAFAGKDVLLVVAAHPLQGSIAMQAEPDQAGPAYLTGVSSIDALCAADCVVTDYSSIAFEAWLSGVPVLFYVPDIDEYRISPGLNVDPEAQFPDAMFRDVRGVAAATMKVVAAAKDEGSRQSSGFEVFMREYAKDAQREGNAQRVAKRCRSLLAV